MKIIALCLFAVILPVQAAEPARPAADFPWTARTYRQGFTTYTDFMGPEGQTRHCRTWKQGWQILIECND